MGTNFKHQQEANSARARDLCKPVSGPVDTSSWRPSDDTHDYAKPTGKQPHPPAFKAGGAVMPARMDRPAKAKGGWIQDAIKKPGALHKSLGVPEGDKIPVAKIKKAADSDNPKLARRAKLAETLEGFNKPGRAHGGRVAPTNINIVISPKKDETPAMPMPGGLPPHPMPIVPPPAGTGGPMPMPPPGMVPGGPPMPPPGMMGRKHGGRVVPGYPIDAGSGGGKGRLEKTKAYGLKP